MRLIVPDAPSIPLRGIMTKQAHEDVNDWVWL